MTGANNGEVKGLIDALEKHYGSLRKAGEALGVDHQLLSYYRKKGKRISDVIELFEKIKKVLRISQKEALKLARQPKIKVD